ncbi:MAG: TonB-dependent receptor [Ekhidna sp.]
MEYKAVDQPLDKVARELSGKYGLKFSYSPKELKKHTLNKRITAQSEAELVSKTFEDFPFKIQLTDGVFLIIPQKPEPQALQGQIVDQASGEPLAFAHIQSDEKGTVSNQNGWFNLPPRTDTMLIAVSYIGYKPFKTKVAPGQTDISLYLQQDATELQEVVLNSPEMEQLSNTPSFFSLNPKHFNSLPSLGETDVFKSIQLLPGVRATDETSSGLSVRGSLPSQNLILMDGFTLYNLDHFFGIFSTLNPNMINNVSIYKGGFGAEYGGRISSVVDVSGKNGMPEKVNGSVGLNMLSANGTLNLPLSSSTSLSLGMRQSFTEIINSDLYEDFLASNRQSFLQSINGEIASLGVSPSLRFYDANAKLQHRIGTNTLLDINFFSSRDKYSGDFIEGDDFSSYNIRDVANWSNVGVSANWKQQITDNWFGTLTVSGSKFSEDERLAVNQTFFADASFNSDSVFANSTLDLFDYQVKSSIEDFTLRSGHELRIDENNLLKAGVEMNKISTDYSADQLLFQNFNQDNNIYGDSLSVSSSIIGAYISHQLTSGDFTSNLGLRGNYFKVSEKVYFEPRFNLNYRLNDHWSLKGAATYHHQFISQNSLSPFQNSDQFYWILADDDIIPVQKSTHFILGASFLRKQWTFDLEYYRKNTTGIVESQFSSLLVENLPQISLGNSDLSGDNISEGIDLFVKYRETMMSSWISYSYGTSTNQFWYVNDNNPYPSNQDLRHEINWTTTFKIGKWELSSIMLYGSGKPFTPPNPIFSETLQNQKTYDDQRINGGRLPAYHRVDLSAKYGFVLGPFNGDFGVTLFNVFNRINIKSRRYSVSYLFDEASSDINATDRAVVTTLDSNLLGFTPNFFINLRF